jgi:hypothetical protein
MVNFKVNNIQIYVFKVKKQKNIPSFFNLPAKEIQVKFRKQILQTFEINSLRHFF